MGWLDRAFQAERPPVRRAWLGDAHGVTGCASIMISPAEVLGAIQEVTWRSVAVDAVGYHFAAQVHRFTGAILPELERFGIGAIGRGPFLLLALEGGYGATGRGRLYAVMTKAVASPEGLTLVACDFDGPEPPPLPGTVMATETLAGGWTYGIAPEARTLLHHRVEPRPGASLSSRGGGLG